MTNTLRLPLNDVVDLFEDLNQQSINYCHWKSNSHLADSIRGLTDLDILVERRQAEQFRRILYQHDIKSVLSPKDKQYPAVEDYLGFDAGTGHLFHLHVHYQLVLGEQFVKNYRLPLEHSFLTETKIWQEGNIKIPTPEYELIVLAIRALLKYRDRDALKDILSIKTPGLPASILSEFTYLQTQADMKAIPSILHSLIDFMSPEIITEILALVTQSPRAGYKLYQLRQKLRRELVPCQYHSRWHVTSQYFGILLRRQFRRYAYDSKKTLATGGMTIAIIGADGAGKSTIIGHMRKYLSWKLKSRTYYMGSQEPSFRSKVLHLGVLFWGKAYRAGSLLLKREHPFNRVLMGFFRLSRNIHHLSISLDRYRRYRTGRQQALQGSIVIYDRYPLTAIHAVMTGKPMDGPHIAAETPGRQDKITQSLSMLEQKIYRKIRPPDYLVRLHVSPSVSQERKPDHDFGMIVAKSRALKEMDQTGLNIIDINADAPFDEVLLLIKKSLWQVL